MDQVKQGLRNQLRVNQGDIVVGFFMDGDDAQLPVIFGVIGNSRYAVNSKTESPFVPFSGYTPETEPGNKTIVKNETGDDSQDTESPVVNLDKKSRTIKKTTGKEYRSTSSAVGSCVHWLELMHKQKYKQN